MVWHTSNDFLVLLTLQSHVSTINTSCQCQCNTNYIQSKQIWTSGLRFKLVRHQTSIVNFDISHMRWIWLDYTLSGKCWVSKPINRSKCAWPSYLVEGMGWSQDYIISWQLGISALMLFISCINKYQWILPRLQILLSFTNLHVTPKLSASVKYSLASPDHFLDILPTSCVPSADITYTNNNY